MPRERNGRALVRLTRPGLAIPLTRYAPCQARVSRRAARMRRGSDGSGSPGTAALPASPHFCPLLRRVFAAEPRWSPAMPLGEGSAAWLRTVLPETPQRLARSRGAPLEGAARSLTRTPRTVLRPLRHDLIAALPGVPRMFPVQPYGLLMQSAGVDRILRISPSSVGKTARPRLCHTPARGAAVLTRHAHDGLHVGDGGESCGEHAAAPAPREELAPTAVRHP